MSPYLQKDFISNHIHPTIPVILTSVYNQTSFVLSERRKVSWSYFNTKDSMFSSYSMVIASVVIASVVTASVVIIVIAWL